MKEVLVALVVSCLVCGCTHDNPVKVVYDIPELSLPPDPIPYTNTLTSKSTPDQVMKAWVATAMQYRGWNQAVRKEVRDIDADI